MEKEHEMDSETTKSLKKLILTVEYHRSKGFKFYKRDSEDNITTTEDIVMAIIHDELSYIITDNGEITHMMKGGW